MAARKRRRKRWTGKRRLWGIYLLFILSLFGWAAGYVASSQGGLDFADFRMTESARSDAISLEEVPPFEGYPYVEINGNVPFFEETEYTTEVFEYYSSLDGLGRCGEAYACIGLELMPTKERGEIGGIKPSGWHTVKYDCVEGKYLYNRCHLIGYQLTGENANEKNLITGTRYMNVVGMLPFENAVDDFIEATNYHVLYRVTPIFEGNDLVAKGVLMEGWSVEDGGRGICFNVFVYNNQPGVEIDYATGESRIAE